jgi:hypothetical protein
MPHSDLPPGSIFRRAELVRLFDLSLELKLRLAEIERRMDALKVDIAARASEIKKPPTIV